MDIFFITVACIFWISEAANEFINNRWSCVFFIDACIATTFTGFLIRKVFVS